MAHPVPEVEDGMNIYKLKVDLQGGIQHPKPGWYHKGLTMIGTLRMDSLHLLAEKVIRDDIPGDFVETGVWRGGACIFMRAILKDHNITDRKVWVCDSFQGVPAADPEHYPEDACILLDEYPILSVPLEEVQQNFKNYDMLDDQVVFVKGWFKDTMPTLPVEKIALLRLDGDLYESTIQVLEALYPKVSQGGIVIVDDYGDMPCCRKAVDEYRAKNGITEPMLATDDSEICWIKGLKELRGVKKPTVAVVVPTWNNFDFLVRMIESVRDYTLDADVHLIVVDNGSTDDTPGYLRSLKQKGVDITIISNETNVGFVKATNQGLKEVREGEVVCLANDDIQIVDPFTFSRLCNDLKDESVGMVVPTSDYVMGLQQSAVSYQIARHRHEANYAIYFCGLMRYDTFKKIGFLDERFGLGGNDDMDYAIRMKEAGYKIIIDRDTFVKHHGSRTLLRNGDVERYKKINEDTRKLLIEKWGEKKVAELFRLPDFLLYGAEYYANFAHGGYGRNEFWLAEWKRIGDKITETLHPTSVLDVGCAHGMLVEALWDKRPSKFIIAGIDISDFAISQSRSDIRPLLRACSIVDFDMVIAPGSLYDLVTCIEVLEHLSERDGKKAIKNICAHANRVLFSSTPNDKEESTHQNVREPEYWIGLFKDNGFEPDTSYDASYLTPWAILFRRSS